MKLPKALSSGEPLDAAPAPYGVEVHLSAYALDGSVRHFVAVLDAPPGLDEVIELEDDGPAYRVTEVRRSWRGWAEVRPDANGALDAAYARLAKRGVPEADEIVFVVGEQEEEGAAEE